MQITLTNARTNAIVDADVWSKLWYFFSTRRVAVWVWLMTLPETTLTAPNSPRLRARLSTTP